MSKHSINQKHITYLMYVQPVPWYVVLWQRRHCQVIHLKKWIERLPTKIIKAPLQPLHWFNFDSRSVAFCKLVSWSALVVVSTTTENNSRYPTSSIICLNHPPSQEHTFSSTLWSFLVSVTWFATLKNSYRTNSGLSRQAHYLSWCKKRKQTLIFHVGEMSMVKWFYFVIKTVKSMS